MLTIPTLTDEQALLEAYVQAELCRINEFSGQIGDDVIALRANVTAYAAEHSLDVPDSFTHYAYLDDPD